MLRAIVICPDEQVSDHLEEVLSDSGEVNVLRALARYPDEAELARVLKANAPEAVFLSVEHLARALQIAATIKRHIPNAHVVPAARSEDRNISVVELNRHGMQALLSFPFEEQEIAATLERIQHALEVAPVKSPATEFVFSFVPAKPGVGASTAAANVAFAASRFHSDRALLIDLDRGNGIVRFLLDIKKDLSLVDAVRNAFRLDETVWAQVITSIEKVDVIHSGEIDAEPRIEPAHIRHILNFARRNYHSIFLDMSGSFEGYSIAALEESKRIFVVITPELSSLHMAREKIRFLKRIGLGDRVAVVVNRAQKKSIVSREQIEDVLQYPVMATFMNDYPRVTFALTAGKPVDADCELGNQISKFAASQLENGSEQRSKFSDYFSLSAAKSLFT